MFQTKQSIEQKINTLENNSPTRVLFESSVSREGHSENEEAFAAICDHVKTLETQDEGSRCTTTELARRIGAVEEYAKELFQFFPCVESVVFTGSALRGKLSPNDIDIIIMTDPKDPDLKILNKYSLAEFAETDIGELEEFVKQHPLNYRGIPCKPVIEFSIDRIASQIPIIQSGPYIAFVKSSLHGTSNAFANTSGTGYLEERKA